ncbi:MAG: excinuclease ABC subunit UvrB [Methanobacteriota archaeon]
MAKTSFTLSAPFAPAGDQPAAIRSLVDGFGEGSLRQTLLGVTGSGKTFTVANVIQALQRPTLVISHNKTLAAQLYEEFREFFPENAVEYFVSYYDYYQPEAYVPQTDTYIAKETSINDEIDRLRHSATQSLMTRSDVVVVASVSCIYGLGNPTEYRNAHLIVHKGEALPRQVLLRRLVDMQYQRKDTDLARSTFRVRGDTIDVVSPDGESAFRIEYWGDAVERLARIDRTTGSVVKGLPAVALYPAKHFVTAPDELGRALAAIEEELADRLAELRRRGKLLEAQRLEQRTKFDLEMIREVGYCSGIENYSRHFDGRRPGEPPYTLLDYFPKDFLLVIDESHVTVPQVRGMYHGDRSRKEVLVEHGFRLPCALDNRPLKFEEFEARVGKVLFTSATPAAFELGTSGRVAEQVVRPTGLLDPEIEVRPARGEVEDLLGEIRKRVEAKERVLVTTLTKRMAEDLTDYYTKLGIRVRYLHADVDTLDRIDLLEALRMGAFDVVVGINLLREGLDLPEVSLVAVLDADKEGFLRSETSLIQTMGRAARNVKGKVILYADRPTESLRRAVDETSRRRKVQADHNAAHGITPKTVEKSIRRMRIEAASVDVKEVLREAKSVEEVEVVVDELSARMTLAAKRLDFEAAAYFRDQIRALKSRSKRA